MVFVVAAKGGVGKTTLTTHLGQRAGEKGLRSVVVDANRGQTDITTYLRLGRAGLPTIADAASAGRFEQAILAADRLNTARHARLDPVAFAAILGPPPSKSDPRLVTADVYRQAGITNPRKDVDCVEMYVPFSWFEPMWLENLGFAEPGEGWKLTEAGVTALDGDLPVNMSGGVLCTNPIGASGMLRFAEAAMQVRGTAGDHQVDGARKAVGHAYGGGSQFFAMWVVGADKP